MASVRFENVSISYGSKQVVKDFSLSVNDGEIMGIIGPSGCGKTTLIRALCGLIKPDKGSIYIADQLVFSDEKRVNIAPERRGVGVVFQDYAVWPHLSVWDNVCYPMKKHKVPKEEIAKRASYALEQVRMTGYEKHMPAQLSGGVQSGTHAGEIHVAKRIPRHIGFTFSRRDTAEHGKTQRASQHLGNKLFHGKHLFFLFQRESSR